MAARSGVNDRSCIAILESEPSSRDAILPSLFGLAGFFVTVLDAFVAGLLIVAGGAAWAAGHRRISTGLEAWLGLTTAVSLAFLVFSLTPLGHAIQLWVLD